jgi:EAL domain-containing protein (putative c-di-GMP-specific phosphodiesterase class I)/ActR/RegA family two-component response regulator
MSTPPVANAVAVLDDDADIAALIADMLRSLGAEPEVFGSAEAFFQRRMHKRFSRLVMDLAMPDMDGVEMLHNLAEQEPCESLVLISGLPVAVVHSAARVAQSLGFSVQGMLTKPFRLSELAQVIWADRQAPLEGTANAFTPTVSDLQGAIDRRELVTYMQPQVGFADIRLVGMEALVRWQHPAHGLIMPSAFIGLAEDSGLAMAITELVCSQALQIARNAQAQFGFSGTVSVNLSPVSLTDLRFPKAMLSLVRAMDFPIQRVCFEVTETSVAHDPDLALEILTRLAVNGFRLAMDDFGTGHSSMDKLAHFPLSELKIDMGFVRGAMRDVRSRVIAEESIVLGHKLGLKVVAEGVESQAHWQWLKAQGCDIAQGYLLGKPIPPALMGTWTEPFSI